MRVFESVRAAAEFLRTTEGNILITTGSKELKEYTKIGNYQERCFARVLSTKAAVEESVRLGFEGKHLIAMQGPFSEELNVAMMRSVHAKWMVTKESGKAGGFGEKVSAAKKAGVGLVVIGRPAEDGISLEDGIKYLEKNFSLAASDGHEKDDADDRPEQVGESCQSGSDLINTDHIAPEKADRNQPAPAQEDSVGSTF